VPALDVGEYCRAVEAYLTRINEGQLVRIVGPAFEIVRGWALSGVPLSIVFHGMSQKAERHKAGRSTRPLRLEFCEDDVIAAYRDWRRAVGIGPIADTAEPPGAEVETKRHPSLPKHLDRSIDRLVRAIGRTDIADAFRDRLEVLVGALSTMRDKAKGLRGPLRDEFVRELAALDLDLASALRECAGAALLDRAHADTVAELAAYQRRLAPDAWQRTVDLGVNRLLREHFGLPVLTFDS
jgi:hypothetical protein